MSDLHLHFLDARGALTELRPWITEELHAAHRLASGRMPLKPIDVVIKAGLHVIPENGHGGQAHGPGRIEVTIDPANPNLDKDPSSFGRMFVHELHHAARWDGIGFGRSLGETLVAEGLAGQFVREVCATPPEMWEDLPGDVVAAFAAEAYDAWDDARYEHVAWFFGSGKYPRWLGYSLSYRLVGAYLAAHPDEAPSRMNAASGSHLRESLKLI